LDGEHFGLEIAELRERGLVRVRPRGDLDMASAPVLAERVAELRDAGKNVLLDLDELEFIDMSGARAVKLLAEEGSRDGWVFTVTRGSACVRRLFELNGFDQALPSYEGSR
jgi:anti-sigma B factor antagonist